MALNIVPIPTPQGVSRKVQIRCSSCGSLIVLDARDVYQGLRCDECQRHPLRKLASRKRRAGFTPVTRTHCPFCGQRPAHTGPCSAWETVERERQRER